MDRPKNWVGLGECTHFPCENGGEMTITKQEIILAIIAIILACIFLWGIDVA